MARHRTHPIAFKRLIFSKPDQGHGARRARTSWAWPNPNYKSLPRAFHQPEFKEPLTAPSKKPLSGRMETLDQFGPKRARLPGHFRRQRLLL